MRHGSFVNGRFRHLSVKAACGRSATLELGDGDPSESTKPGLLGHLQRIIDFDAEIPDGALERRVSEQECIASVRWYVFSSAIRHRARARATFARGRR